MKLAFAVITSMYKHKQVSDLSACSVVLCQAGRPEQVFYLQCRLALGPRLDRTIGRASWSCTDGFAQPAGIPRASAAPAQRTGPQPKPQPTVPRHPTWSECGRPLGCSV